MRCVAEIRNPREKVCPRLAGRSSSLELPQSCLPSRGEEHFEQCAEREDPREEEENLRALSSGRAVPVVQTQDCAGEHEEAEAMHDAHPQSEIFDFVMWRLRLFHRDGC